MKGRIRIFFRDDGIWLAPFAWDKNWTFPAPLQFRDVPVERLGQIGYSGVKMSDMYDKKPKEQ